MTLQLGQGLHCLAPQFTEPENRDEVLSTTQSRTDGQMDEWVATSPGQLQVWEPGSSGVALWVSGPGPPQSIRGLLGPGARGVRLLCASGFRLTTSSSMSPASARSGTARQQSKSRVRTWLTCRVHSLASARAADRGVGVVAFAEWAPPPPGHRANLEHAHRGSHSALNSFSPFGGLIEQQIRGGARTSSTPRRLLLSFSNARGRTRSAPCLGLCDQALFLFYLYFMLAFYFKQTVLGFRS